jgi:hypothetical protein
MIVPVRVSRPPPDSPRNPTRQHKSLVTIDDYKEPFLASQCRKPLLYPTELRGRDDYDTVGIEESLAGKTLKASNFQRRLRDNSAGIGKIVIYVTWNTRSAIPSHSRFSTREDVAHDHY